MATARPRKTSFENQKMWSCDYFAIIPPSLNFAVLVKYAKTEPQVAPFKKMERIQRILLFLCLLGRQNRKCGNFTLLFCRGRHGIISKCVPHVQHAYILLDQSNS